MSIAENIAQVRAHMAEACRQAGRAPEEVTLVGASKMNDAQACRDAIAAGIDAKHSNEDQIAPFTYWVEQYGDRIGNFGGIDTDAVCRLDPDAMFDYIQEVVSKSVGHGGFAFGSGNSIPDYVPAEGYRSMNQSIRKIRGDFDA